MPKADVDPKSFLPNSSTWKCAGVTCARRQRPSQLVPLSHIPTGCPRAGRREAEPVLAPAPMLQGGSSRMDGPITERVHGPALSSPSHLQNELLVWAIFQKHRFHQYLMCFCVFMSNEPPRSGGHRGASQGRLPMGDVRAGLDMDIPQPTGETLDTWQCVTKSLV